MVPCGEALALGRLWKGLVSPQPACEDLGQGWGGVGWGGGCDFEPDGEKVLNGSSGKK